MDRRTNSRTQNLADTVGEFVYEFPGFKHCAEYVKDVADGKSPPAHSPFSYFPCQGVSAAQPLVRTTPKVYLSFIDSLICMYNLKNS
jgi:hypothetical protein